MILVTGATGFVGAEVCRQLTAQGLHFKAAKRKTSVVPDFLLNHQNILWFDADLNDFDVLETLFVGVTKVYHCAALVSFDNALRTKLFKVNIEGTANIVNLCLQNKVRLLHVSSVAALGESKNKDLITEEDYFSPTAKTHAYGLSKYESEMEVWRGVAEGLDAVIVNPSVIIGAEAAKKGSGAIFQLIKNGLRFYTSGGAGFVAVQDVVKNMLFLMESNISGERFILSAENYTYQKLFSEIAIAFHQKPPTKKAQPWLLEIIWRLAFVASFITQKPSMLTKYTVKISLKKSFYSNAKILNTSGLVFGNINQSILEICSKYD
ncbi:MAG: NAD-dependent epimerase/dehydratase family protein [Sphingobacteriaceae bacterium]|nr:NAD-dependent epimerase/dehydratase family protein [Sphingobacteriaceae bacterium]